MNDFMNQSGKAKIIVLRADGHVEDHGDWGNLFLNNGMDYLAVFQSTAPGSVMNHMAVGTISTAATLTDVVGSMGEVSRVTMATRTVPNSNNVLVEVATFAGNTNGITSVSLREVVVVNDARSGPNGTGRSRAVFAAVVLAASDFLRVSYETTVGSRA